MKKRLFSALAILLIASLGLTALAAEQHALAEKLVRLHVLANSDSAADQSLKLKVRDAVLAFTAGIGEDELAASLDDVERVAEAVVREEGFGYDVTVSLGDESYGTRDYDTFSLPAGIYRSLRVEIGSGDGQNWWCVLFPPLCFASSESFAERAEAAGLSKEEIYFVTKSGDEVQIRFRILELFQKAVSIFND